jgi:hypothetical protein
VEEKAQAVLDARAPHLSPRGMSTLADVYDPNTMPRELHRAHAEPDPIMSEREVALYL